MLDTIISDGKPYTLESESYEVESIIEKLSYTIIGQDQAKREIAEAISGSIHQIVPKNGPIAVLLFVGPTGTGKSESVKALANILLGDRDKIVKMNGEQFQESHTVGRLFGAPPAYVGYNDPPILEQINKMQKEAMDSKTASHLVKRLGGFNILLIDEIEKVHSQVLQSLLAVFDDGSCTLANGKTIDLTSTLIICTSNIGETEKRENREKRSIGFTTNKEGDDTKIFSNSMKKFSPEFQGRIDSIVHFNSITKEDSLLIIDKLTKELNDELNIFKDNLYTKFSIALTEGAKDLLIIKGFSKDKGAREIGRTFKRMIDAPLGKIMDLHSDMHEFPEYQVKIRADAVDENIIFYIDPKDISNVQVEVKQQVTYLLTHNKHNRHKKNAK